MSVQWAHLGGELVVASSRGAWIQQPQLSGATFAWPMSDAVPATPATTRHLLDGAIAAAERAAVAREQPPMTALRWAWQLLNQWYSAHHSIALLPRAVERFAADGRLELAQFASQKLADERGHDELPLADLTALGYDARALTKAVAPAAWVEAGVEYARQALAGERPIEFLGYVYAIERRVIRIPETWFASLEQALPVGVHGTSGLRSHATMLDLEHVADAVEFFSTLPAADRSAIAAGCHQITRIRCAWLADIQPSEEDLAVWFQPFAGYAHLQKGDAA
jgi:hypothetical protein